MDRSVHPSVAAVAGSLLVRVGGWRTLGVMARTSIDIDDKACAAVMRRYRLKTKREAINFALGALADEPLSVEAARKMRGPGWEGALDAMRSDRA